MSPWRPSPSSSSLPVCLSQISGPIESLLNDLRSVSEVPGADNCVPNALGYDARFPQQNQYVSHSVISRDQSVNNIPGPSTAGKTTSTTTSASPPRVKTSAHAASSTSPSDPSALSPGLTGGTSSARPATSPPAWTGKLDQTVLEFQR
ncbi:uncharacterized protein DSM5745_02105 [Aspergillus mulundensis]|uniref:Uncharacterized protein n=1 Tax=Aspergillus mulundensis TaxID=1810919 RepID=A0A3D8SVK3_9EURO|nr:hypothetical protein DSM5745_02105 [Aspergillus mulundensis]RDW90330.1 hypothetical protein DSM5745_02105 [Aspergillus mulundensis]